MARKPRDYRSYPSYLAEMTAQLEKVGSGRWGPMTQRDATRLQSQITGWWQSLRHAADAEDEWAIAICQILAKTWWSTTPTTGGAGAVYFTGTLNPTWLTPA